MPSQEEELAGGNVTKVVRIGNTVRRASGPCTPTIHRLLAHVRAKGLLWVPEPLGLDEAGREILSFLPGEVPHGMPAWIWARRILTDVARALRAWHDATADFSAPDAPWGLPASSPREVICHNDFAPYNCVFRNGVFAGAIDFDMCSPGSRIWDLAYTAYRYVPLLPGPDAQPALPGDQSPFGVPEMIERLEAFLSAYGAAGGCAAFGRAELMRTAAGRLDAIAAWTEDFARRSGNAGLAHHPAMYRSHARWVEGLIPRG